MKPLKETVHGIFGVVATLVIMVGLPTMATADLVTVTIPPDSMPSEIDLANYAAAGDSVVINVTDQMGQVGSAPPYAPYDLHGAVINLLAGGELGHNSSLTRGHLNVQTGGVLGTFANFTYGTLTLSGGEIGRDLHVGDSAIPVNTYFTMASGTVGAFAVFYENAIVNISGGEFTGGFDASYGSQLNISGGLFLDTVNALFFNNGSSSTISGGEFHPILAVGGGDVEITGGTFTGGADLVGHVTIGGGDFSFVNSSNKFRLSEYSHVDLIGTYLEIGGVDVTPVLGQTITITQRSGEFLLAQFASGEVFELQLNGFKVPDGYDYVSPDAVVTFTTVPTPSTGAAFVFFVVSMAVKRRR